MKDLLSATYEWPSKIGSPSPVTSTWQFNHHNAALRFALDLWPICFMWSCVRECTSHTHLADSWVIPLCRYQLLFKCVPGINLAVAAILDWEKVESHLWSILSFCFFYIAGIHTNLFYMSLHMTVETFNVTNKAKHWVNGKRLCNHYNPIITPTEFEPQLQSQSICVVSPVSLVCNKCLGC